MALALRTDRQYTRQEIVVERPDGSRRTALAHASPFHDEAGRVIGAVNVLVDITDRRLAEEQLRRSEEHLRAVVETTPACIKVVAADGTLLDMNSAGLAMVEADGLETVKGESVYCLIREEDRDAFRAFNERVCAGERGSLEFEVVGLRGTRRHMETHAVPLRRPGRGLVQLAITHDITQRKRAEAVLRESEERFRATVNQAAVGVTQVGMDNRALWANPGLCAMLGYAEAELRKKTFIDMTHPEDVGADLALAQKLLAGEVPSYRVEKRYLHKNGSVVWGDLAVSLVRGSDGRPRYAVGVVVDVTERKQAEARLGALVCYDRQFRYTFVNDRAAQVLGKRKDELLGRCIWELFPDAVGNQYHRELHQALAEQRVIRSENYYAPFGKWFENHIYPSPDGLTVFSADVTWRKELEQELKQRAEQLAEADRRKDEFLATLAHELRNPLAPLRNALQILKMPRVDAQTVERSREMMERQVQHLVRLVDDLLDVSRVMRGKITLHRERVELAAVVARAVETVQPLVDAQRHELSVRVSSDSLLLDADPVRLAQVVGNLLTNAAKYTEPGGRIWLTAERDGDRAVLRVRDNGIGIAPDMLPRIFELFVQVDHAAARSQGGLGIGLTLVKNLVEMHNGFVQARSGGPGKGSEFVVKLPLVAQAPCRDQATERGRQADQLPPPSGKRLLVVDDNQDAADSLAMLLRLRGHEVRVAYSGVAALEMTKAYAPDVVFLDIGMPGMDGYEVARRLRQTPGLENVMLAALTGWGQQEDRRRTAEAGFDHHLVKPPEPEVLERLLAK